MWQKALSFSQHVHAGAVALVICHNNETPESDVEFVAHLVCQMHPVGVGLEVYLLEVIA